MTGAAWRPPPGNVEDPAAGTAGPPLNVSHGLTAEASVHLRYITIAINDPTLAAEQLADAFRGRARARLFLRDVIAALSP